MPIACWIVFCALLASACGSTRLEVPAFDAGSGDQEGNAVGTPPSAGAGSSAGAPAVQPIDAGPPRGERDAGQPVDADPAAECTEGARRCLDEHAPELCGPGGSWIAGAACTEDLPLCLNGECAQCNSLGERRCAGDDLVERCAGRGYWVQYDVCDADQVCMEGACRCRPDPTPSQCLDDTTPQYCDESGAWQAVEACEGIAPVCLDGACVACRPGGRACIDATTIDRCATDGSSQLQACPDGTSCEGESCRRRVLALSAGAFHACAILETGLVKCWGANAGQLGLGDLEERGDEPGEMGEALPAVDLGTGRSAQAISVGEAHACALLDNGDVKCWGGNDSGQLGLGDGDARGDEPGEMGDALPAVNLGTGRTAVEISAGILHSCALLDNGQVKCWGDNSVGQLGLGDTENRGDDPGEMGDALPAVSLGAMRTVQAVRAGHYTCALLDGGEVKCWGDALLAGLYDDHGREIFGDEPGEMGDALEALDFGTGRSALGIELRVGHLCALLDNQDLKCRGYNQGGQAGVGSDKFVYGTQPSERGDAWPAVPLGTDRYAVEVAPGAEQTCVLLDDGQLKCWGAGFEGILGHGAETDPIGDQPGELGDALPAVDLGSGVSMVAIEGGYLHTCALLDTGQAKCWGSNLEGALGLGDLEPRGDEPGEMGDALPTVDLGY